MIAKEHLDVFARNGFELSEDSSSGHLRLAALPFSKNTTFGPDDVAELVGALQRGEPEASLRPARCAPPLLLVATLPPPAAVCTGWGAQSSSAAPATTSTRQSAQGQRLSPIHRTAVFICDV